LHIQKQNSIFAITKLKKITKATELHEKQAEVAVEAKRATATRIQAEQRLVFIGIQQLFLILIWQTTIYEKV
jgi:hypothetical protein